MTHMGEWWKKIGFKGKLWEVTTLENPPEKGIQQPTRFGLGLSYFREHKVKCKFQDTLDQIYNSNGDTEISCY